MALRLETAAAALVWLLVIALAFNMVRGIAEQVAEWIVDWRHRGQG